MAIVERPFFSKVRRTQGTPKRDTLSWWRECPGLWTYCPVVWSVVDVRPHAGLQTPCRIGANRSSADSVGVPLLGQTPFQLY